MFKTILVPLDGSELADRILWQVKRLLKREDAQVTLLCAVDPAHPSEREKEDFRGDEALRLRLDHAARDFERLREVLADDGVSAQVVIRPGHAADTILSYAEAEDVSLIAMATHGRSGPSRWLRGSVAERVLRRASAPLLLCNPRSAGSHAGEARFRRILVPLDGSDRAAGILPLVTEVARAYEASVSLLRVGRIITTPVEYPLPEFVRVPTEAVMREELEPHRAALEAAGLTASVSVVFEASEAEAILGAVKSEDADLIAMTTHGWSGLDRWLFGSVAEKVLRSAEVPLLVKRVAAFGAGDAA